MISNYTLYTMDPQTGEHYVTPASFPYTDSPVVFQIPHDKLLTLYTNLTHYRNTLYERLKQVDQDFYVLVEQKPGQGFERVIPTEPVYAPERVKELREITLHEIETLLNTSVHLHYYVSPETLEVTGVLEYPNPQIGKEYLHLTLAPPTLDTRAFKNLNFGEFFIALQNKAPV